MKNSGINEILKPFKKELLEVLKESRIDICFVFGSVARGEADETSDVDICFVTKYYLETEELKKFKIQLELITGRKVDLANMRMLPTYIIQSIIKDRVDINNI